MNLDLTEDQRIVLARLEALEADGWMVVHHRAYDTCHFGPFSTPAEAWEWCLANEVGTSLVPLYRTVDWSR